MRAARPWTDERIETLKVMWTRGVTAQAIADRLGGLSRSAVLGKLFRLRREAAPPAPQPPAEPSNTAPPRRKRGKRLLDLGNDCCRWPYGTPGSARFFFCGAPGADLKAGRPYCTTHARRAYRKRPNRIANSELPTAADSPPIAPRPLTRRYVWRAPVRHPAARWR